MKRAVIVGGAPIGRIESIRSYLRADDFFIYCDGGLRHMAALGRKADLIVGDFDSHENPHAAAETIVLPHEKDDTDSFAIFCSSAHPARGSTTRSATSRCC